MFLFSAILMGLRDIWGHKLRSILTLFCILLGVSSVVVTTGYMRGMTESWKVWIKERGGVEKLGLRQRPAPSFQRHIADLSPGSTLADVEAVRHGCTHIRYISPVVEVGDDNPIYRGGERTRTDIEGVTHVSQYVERFDLARGRFITDMDNADQKQVIVIGTEVRDDLFKPGEDPMGQFVTLGGIPFKVVGVLKHYEHMRGTWNVLHWKNDQAFIPLTTALNKVLGTDQLSGLELTVEDPIYVDQVIQQAENAIRGAHRGIQDFRVESSSEWMDSIDEQEKNLVTAGSAVSLITIIIGGIGIMNLMLASINERVREIGIRKAVGARGGDIFFQFCVESMTLCVLGGVVGVIAGTGVIYWLREAGAGEAQGMKPEFTMIGLTMGFGASVAIGVIAGLYPALKASRLDPIEALRYE
ncbi:MAG: ABC transporter permease [Verrucomicrobiales bacterium]